MVQVWNDPTVVTSYEVTVEAPAVVDGVHETVALAEEAVATALVGALGELSHDWPPIAQFVAAPEPVVVKPADTDSPGAIDGADVGAVIVTSVPPVVGAVVVVAPQLDDNVVPVGKTNCRLHGAATVPTGAEVGLMMVNSAW